ncbi:MAG: aminopeptidase family protein P, partial [Bacteroidota bacterium]
GDLSGEIWTDRPELPGDVVRDHSADLAGQTRAEKLTQIREAMAADAVDFHLITTLDDIAWLTNLRGTDIRYNPVFMAYLLLSPENATLFINANKISPDLRALLEKDGYRLASYASIGSALEALPSGTCLRLDKSATQYQLFQEISEEVEIMGGATYTSLPKACKNATEQSHIRSVMVRDGVAMVRLLIWLEEALKSELVINELDVEAQLEAFRQAQANYQGPSFRTICGYADHGAIVHYAASPESAHALRTEGILLLDSGGQYLDGTTDITRTISLGSPTPEQQADYTRVLLGHIALADVVFPAGTKGYQLDVLARGPLWKAHQNYGHGTGHGVGFFLNVHEGPQGISPAASRKTPFKPGMLTSVEPGLYREGKYGIRIENLVLCQDAGSSDFGEFMHFETVTLCPIDKQLIDREQLGPEGREWLDAYHDNVYQQLAPALNPLEKDWLRKATAPL